MRLKREIKKVKKENKGVEINKIESKMEKEEIKGLEKILRNIRREYIKLEEKEEGLRMKNIKAEKAIKVLKAKCEELSNDREVK